MQYLSFTLQDYRAISDPIKIPLSKNSLIPVIGINECGKTTILSAIFAFDYLNDTLNEGRQLKDTENLYQTSPADPIVTAEINLTLSEFETILDDVDSVIKDEIEKLKELPTSLQSIAKIPRNESVLGELKNYRRKRRQFPKNLSISRNLKKRQYGFEVKGFAEDRLNDLIGHQIVRRMPYILFFDDFRDSVEEIIEIPQNKDEPTGWLAIINQLFVQTDSSFSIFSLPGMEERRRKGILAKVKKHLNETLTKEWQTFRLDDIDALEISIDFYTEEVAGSTTRKSFIKLEIIETDGNGDKHYFFIRDRSKGFFWFFNFVMKLEFNPKVIDDESHTIYLLDEPGSYLHALAQTKLCKKLRQIAENSRVIYCTHSHYLLDPEVIPLSAIKIAEKTSDGVIKLLSIYDFKGSISENRNAFQPIIDALRIKPVLLDHGVHPVLITEGIYDYYVFDLFKKNRQFRVLPSVGAPSIQYYISLMIAWGVDFRALWDCDVDGKKAKELAEKAFGEQESKSAFFLLPHPLEKGRKCILQDLFEGEDLLLMRRELDIPQSSPFEKTISELYFSKEKNKIIAMISEKTISNVERVFVTCRLV